MAKKKYFGWDLGSRKLVLHGSPAALAAITQPGCPCFTIRPQKLRDVSSTVRASPRRSRFSGGAGPFGGRYPFRSGVYYLLRRTGRYSDIQRKRGCREVVVCAYGQPKHHVLVTVPKRARVSESSNVFQERFAVRSMALPPGLYLLSVRTLPRRSSAGGVVRTGADTHTSAGQYLLRRPLASVKRTQ